MKAITVKTQFDGVHYYPNAPIIVDFLRQPHRHMFIVRITLGVKHNNRDLEFFVMKGMVDKFISKEYPKDHLGRCDLGCASCEMVAEAIVLMFKEHFEGDGRTICVEVSEDDENSACVSGKSSSK